MYLVDAAPKLGARLRVFRRQRGRPIARQEPRLSDDGEAAQSPTKVNMSDLPKSESTDPREQDHGELFRSDTRQLPTSPLKLPSRKTLYVLLTAAAAIAAAVIASGR